MLSKFAFEAADGREARDLGRFTEAVEDFVDGGQEAELVGGTHDFDGTPEGGGRAKVAAELVRRGWDSLD